MSTAKREAKKETTKPNARPKARNAKDLRPERILGAPQKQLEAATEHLGRPPARTTASAVYIEPKPKRRFKYRIYEHDMEVLRVNYRDALKSERANIAAHKSAGLTWVYEMFSYPGADIYYLWIEMSPDEEKPRTTIKRLRPETRLYKQGRAMQFEEMN